MTKILIDRSTVEQALEFIRTMNQQGWMLADYEDDMERTVAGLEVALAQEQPEHDPALSAAQGWPGGISDPVLDRKTLLQQVAALAQEPAGCETEADCTSQPWCRISGECHRKQKSPEPAQEPVAWALHTGTRQGIKWNREVEHGTPLYTAPPQRPPLTDEEMRKLWSQYGYKSALCMRFARAVERKVRGETE